MKANRNNSRNRDATYAKMIGKRCPMGPGGRDCVCCGQAPGQDRKIMRRTMKRAERQAWKMSLDNA